MPITYEQKSSTPDQAAIGRQKLAAKREEQNKILRKLESGETTKLAKSELNKLEAVDRLHWSRTIKIIGG